MAISPGATLGSYEVLQQIGAGGMGEVYKANDRRVGNLVFDMSRDASRFFFSIVPEALNQSSVEDSPLTVVVNWTSELKQ